jgi:hypothetical protein
LRDAIELEWAGVPAVAIVHQSQEGSAKAMALVSGMPDYPFITLGYPYVPLAVWSDDEVREAAEKVVDAVRRRLTADPGG